MSVKSINVIGAGLAGCEAAWQAARLGVHVNLYEMKPEKKSPAHHKDSYAELVCSNSLRSNDPTNAVGLLKEEMHRLGSLVLEAAYATEVPAGSALAVNRDAFSAYITEKIKQNPNISVFEGQEITEINFDENNVCAFATLTSFVTVTSDKRQRCLGTSYLTDEEFLDDDSVVTVYYPDASESLFSIAKRFHTSVGEIAESNRLSENVFASFGAPVGNFEVKKLIIK